MFLFNEPPISYIDPWTVPFEERIKALKKGDRHVAYFFEYPDYGTFRYRVYNMIQALLESKSKTSAAYFAHDDLDVLGKVVDIADVLVVGRSKYNEKLNYAITHARSKGKPVVYDVDDLIFDLAYVHLILNTLDKDVSDNAILDRWFALVGRIGAAMKLCDRAITTNEYLAARLQPHFEKPVSVIPNFLNREQVEISERIFRQKKASGFARNDRVYLGYFSGTQSHNKDLEIMSDALTKLLQNNPNMVLRIVGYIDIRGILRNYISQIEQYPIQDFINLQRLIGQVEVNLVPLQDNEFTNCKSELKYFEASMAGTICIATPTYAYAQSITDGKNGYLSKSFEWYEKIQNVINLLNTNSYPEMAQEAFDHSKQVYTWYNQRN